MAKRKKMNRLGGIHIPDELKKRAVCAACKKSISGTVSDPVISAPSLGIGSYHDRCAREIWSEMRAKENEEYEKKESRRKVKRPVEE